MPGKFLQDMFRSFVQVHKLNPHASRRKGVGRAVEVGPDNLSDQLERVLKAGEFQRQRQFTVELRRLMAENQHPPFVEVQRRAAEDLVCYHEGDLTRARGRLYHSFVPLRFRFDTYHNRPYILSVAFPGYEGEVLARLVEQDGVIVGAGSACSARSGKPSHVLTAMGVPAPVARSTLRFSFGHSTTPDAVDRLVCALRTALGKY